jgi:hypothetical protein
VVKVVEVVGIFGVVVAFEVDSNLLVVVVEAE